MTSWQDVVMSIGQWVFIIALLPAIVGKDKPPWMTSLLTATVLSVFAFTFWTLGMIMSAISGSITALCWWVLLVQVTKAQTLTK